jgi:hypothetical protein
MPILAPSAAMAAVACADFAIAAVRAAATIAMICWPAMAANIVPDCIACSIFWIASWAFASIWSRSSRSPYRSRQTSSDTRAIAKYRSAWLV